MMAYKNGEDHTGTNDSERLDKNRSTNELWRYETPQEPGIFDLRLVEESVGHRSFNYIMSVPQ